MTPNDKASGSGPPLSPNSLTNPGLRTALPPSPNLAGTPTATNGLRTALPLSQTPPETSVSSGSSAALELRTALSPFQTPPETSVSSGSSAAPGLRTALSLSNLEISVTSRSSATNPLICTADELLNKNKNKNNGSSSTATRFSNVYRYVSPIATRTQGSTIKWTPVLSFNKYGQIVSESSTGKSRNVHANHHHPEQPLDNPSDKDEDLAKMEQPLADEDEANPWIPVTTKTKSGVKTSGLNTISGLNVYYHTGKNTWEYARSIRNNVQGKKGTKNAEGGRKQKDRQYL